MKKRPQSSKTKKVGKQTFPRGWDAKQVKDVIAHYDRQTGAGELAEYEKAMKVEKQAVMLVPKDLVPVIRRLISRQRGA